jgi:putative endonuclease
MSFWLYILRCVDGSYYTGHTENLEKRVAEHQASVHPDCYTASRLPVELVFSQSFSSRAGALQAEIRIKKWRRVKKEALIRQDWTELSRLSKTAKNLQLQEG